MLEPLKGADRATKGEALLGIVNRHIQSTLGAAQLLKGEQYSRPVIDCFELRPAISFRTQQLCGTTIEFEAG